jgi:hypothetical protein
MSDPDHRDAVAEIEDGIAKPRREGARRKSVDLAAWPETVLHLHDDRVPAFDMATARIAGAISDRARGLGLRLIIDQQG